MAIVLANEMKLTAKEWAMRWNEPCDGMSHETEWAPCDGRLAVEYISVEMAIANKKNLHDESLNNVNEYRGKNIIVLDISFKMWEKNETLHRRYN